MDTQGQNQSFLTAADPVLPGLAMWRLNLSDCTSAPITIDALSDPEQSVIHQFLRPSGVLQLRWSNKSLPPPLALHRGLEVEMLVTPLSDGRGLSLRGSVASSSSSLCAHALTLPNLERLIFSDNESMFIPAMFGESFREQTSVNMNVMLHTYILYFFDPAHQWE